MGTRAPLISSAVFFLRDPSTANSPLAQRISFLESKGLSPQEIEQAISQANGPAQQQPYYAGPRGGRMSREYERDWRDWFIMAVVGGSVGWVALKLAQKYLLPSLQPPSSTDLEAAQAALEAKYDEAQSLLVTLQQSTDSLAASLDEQRSAVEKELESVRSAVEEMREAERRREEWASKVGSQVEEVVRTLPALVEKQATSTGASLTELQGELKSLKSLLIARRPAAPSPSASSSSPSLVGAGIPNAPAPGNNVIPPPATSTSPYTPTTSTSTATPSPPLFSSRKPGIPAWQMRGTTAQGLASSQTSLPGSAYIAPAPGGGAAVAAQGAGEDKVVEDTSASGVLVEKEDASATVAQGEGTGEGSASAETPSSS